MKKNKNLISLEKEIEVFKDYFIKRYFVETPTDLWWVGDEVGAVLIANDYFFDLSTMIDYIKYDYSIDDMFDHYDYSLNQQMKDKSSICIRDWRKLRSNKVEKYEI